MSKRDPIFIDPVLQRLAGVLSDYDAVIAAEPDGTIFLTVGDRTVYLGGTITTTSLTGWLVSVDTHNARIGAGGAPLPGTAPETGVACPRCAHELVIDGWAPAGFPVKQTASYPPMWSCGCPRCSELAFLYAEAGVR